MVPVRRLQGIARAAPRGAITGQSGRMFLEGQVNWVWVLGGLAAVGWIIGLMGLWLTVCFLVRTKSRNIGGVSPSFFSSSGVVTWSAVPT